MLRSASACVWVAAPSAARRPPSPVVAALVLFTRRNSRSARIYSVVVDPACRGRGLGAMLVRAAEREARRRGCALMSLEVREDNRAARAMYEKLGYGPHAALPAYYEDGAPGLRLRKPLNPPRR